MEGNGRIERAHIYDNSSKSQQIVPIEVDDVVVNIGFESSLGPIKDWGLDLEGGQIRVIKRFATLWCAAPAVDPNATTDTTAVGGIIGN